MKTNSFAGRRRDNTNMEKKFTVDELREFTVHNTKKLL